MSCKKDIALVLEESKGRFTIETANLAKKEDVFNFFQQAYADQFNAADFQNSKDFSVRWEWANVKNPNIEDNEFPAWFCKDKESEEIVGHLGVIPVSINIKNSLYRAVWGRDMITPLKWRKKGIASFLFNTAMEKTKGKAAVFLLGGANDYAVAIYKKLGFIHLGYIPLYVRIIKFDTILQNFIKSELLRNLLGLISKSLLCVFYIPSWLIRKMGEKNIYIKEVTSFDNSFDILWKKTASLFPIIVCRDSKSLSWRFIDQPYWDYKIFKVEDKENGELQGYFVLREGKSHGLSIGVVSDFFASPEDTDTMISMGKFIIRYFKEKGGIDLIRCDILSKSFERILKKIGFIRVRSRSHFLVGNIDETIDSEFIRNRRNWFINYADSDLDLSGQR